MRVEMEIRKLEADMLTEDTLLGFKHHQVILKKWINLKLSTKVMGDSLNKGGTYTRLSFPKNIVKICKLMYEVLKGTQVKTPETRINTGFLSNLGRVRFPSAAR